MQFQRMATRPWLSALAAALAICSMVLPGCARQEPPPGPAYRDAPKSVTLPPLRFAVNPAHNPRMLTTAYQPLMDLLNTRQDKVRFELEASRDHAGFETKLAQREPEFVLANPWQTLQAIKGGYQVIAMAGLPGDFRGLILVRKDGEIKSLRDLVGKSISYPAPTAVAAAMMPQLYLQNHGIHVTTDTISKYVGSQESSIMNVYLRETSAGATWPGPWRDFQKAHPAEAAQLTVAWETEPLVNNSIMVRKGVSAELVALVKETLFGLDTTPEGRAILVGMERERFSPASDADYQVVERFVEEFERKVRKAREPK